MRTGALRIANILTGSILLLAAAAKSFDPASGMATFKADGISSNVLQGVLLATLIVVEAVLGILLLTGITPPLVLRITQCLFIIFSIQLAYIFFFLKLKHCGCIGSMLMFDSRYHLLVWMALDISVVLSMGLQLKYLGNKHAAVRIEGV